MKKLLVTVLFTGIVFSAAAAELPGQGFGVQIGWAQPILRLNNPHPSFPKDSLMNVTKLNGFKVGVVYDASFIAGFGSSIGINYTFGASSTPWTPVGNISEYPRSRTTTLYHEMEVFVDWQYKFELAKETYLILYTGPSLQCGIAFTERNTIQSQFIDGSVNSVTNDYDRYGEQRANEDIKRINVTWGVGAGFQYQQYFLRGGYDFGIINPYKGMKFEDLTGNEYDRYTRGRLDQWSIKIGMYIWYKD